MNFKLGIWGWWQGQNLGDQWIKETMKKIFPTASFINTDEKLNGYDFLICGGGGLFIRDIPHNLTKISNKVPFGVIGMGAEFPHNDNDAEALASRSSFFYVRDLYSLDCMHIKNVARSYDITFANPLSIVEQKNLANSKCFFVWRTPDEWMLKDKNFKDYQRANYDFTQWETIINSNFSKVKYDDFLTYDSNIQERVNGYDFVISGRYHGIIAAVQMGIPCIGIDVCPKIRSLMKEIGIEEYCLKYDEVYKLEGKIKSAKENADDIRKKLLTYRAKAISTIEIHIDSAKFEILKIAKPLKIIHYGNYYFGSNDVVSVMADALKSKANAKCIEIKKYHYILGHRIAAETNTPNGTITILKTWPVLFDYLIYKPDVIVLNSGGLVFSNFCFKVLKKLKLLKIDLELSDPDVFPYNGKIYATFFDLFYTNAAFTKNEQYKQARLLGFAASIKHHYYIPEIERKFDVVVVGGCRADRIPIVNELRKHFKVGVFGSGWENSEGVVSGEDLVKAINSGKIYLSFAKTMAGFMNVKVGLFEAIACKSFVITDYMEELENYFKIDKEIVCYQSIEELVRKISYYLENENERLEIADNAYQRFLNEHTYEERWNRVLRDIYEKKGIDYESIY